MLKLVLLPYNTKYTIIIKIFVISDICIIKIITINDICIIKIKFVLYDNKTKKIICSVIKVKRTMK